MLWIVDLQQSSLNAFTQVLPLLCTGFCRYVLSYQITTVCGRQNTVSSKARSSPCPGGFVVFSLVTRPEFCLQVDVMFPETFPACY